MLDFYLSYETLIATIGIGSLYALSLSILMRGGVFSLAHSGFGAIGAYTTALLVLHLDLPAVVTLPLAMLASGGVAALVAMLVGRLRYVFLTIATVAFSQLVIIVLNNAGSVTGGPLGLDAIPQQVGPATIWLCVAAVAICLGRLGKTRFGRSVAALEADEAAARAQGIDVAVARIRMFALSGMIAGLAGGLAALFNYHVDPSQFGLAHTLAVVMYTVVGGISSVIGLVLGATFVNLIPEFLRSWGLGAGWFSVALQGLVLLGVILFFPRGFSRLFPSSRRGTVPEPLEPERGVPIALDVEDITVTFGGVRALEGVRLHVAPGEVLGLVGPNGAGKTTLINVITGTCRPDGGSVRLDGVEITGQPVHRTARRGVARTFQNLRIFGDLTCRENVIAGGITKMPSAGVGQVAGLPVARRIGREQAARAAGLLDQVGLMERDLEKAESLAYGEQRRLEMARAVASRPGLLILDEPAAGMNETEAREIAGVIRLYADSGHTVLVVEHNMALIRRSCDRVVVLASGKVIAEGPPEDVVRDEQVIEAYLGS